MITAFVLVLTSSITAASVQTQARPRDSAEVVAVVARFHGALASGDSAAALGLLDRDAIILESGAAETRDEYRSHHLPADIEFARAVKSKQSVVGVSVSGTVAWVASISTTKGLFEGRQINSDGAELIVLRRTNSGWRIAAVHWSSRARKLLQAGKT